MVLDHADGEVARLTMTESVLGEWLDVVVDTVVHTTLMLALGVAASRLAARATSSASSPPSASSSAPSSASSGPRRPAAAPRHLLDRLTSRDGFYIMLSLFVVLGLSRPTLLPGLIVVVAVELARLLGGESPRPHRRPP